MPPMPPCLQDLPAKNECDEKCDTTRKTCREACSVGKPKGEKKQCKIKCKNAKNSCKSYCVRCTETVMLHVTASARGGGNNSRRQLADEELPLTASDYSDNDKLSLQEKVADVAGVNKSLVTIAVTADNADNVLNTATITVPASMTAADVMASLSSKLGTADAASQALGIKVVTVSVTSTSQPTPTPTPTPTPSCPASLASICGTCPNQDKCGREAHCLNKRKKGKCHKKRVQKTCGKTCSAVLRAFFPSRSARARLYFERRFKETLAVDLTSHLRHNTHTRPPGPSLTPHATCAHTPRGDRWHQCTHTGFASGGVRVDGDDGRLAPAP